MRVWVPIIRALAVFLLLIFFTAFVTRPSGSVPKWRMDGKQVNFPLSIRVSRPTWLDLETEVVLNGRSYLVLPRMGLSNVEVFLNGKMIWNAGDEDHHSRMWTYTFYVPLDVNGKGILKVKSYALYDVRINWPPYITKSPWKDVFLSNLLFSDFPALFFGVAITLGALIISLSKYIQNFKANLKLGIASVLMALFMIDYTYTGLFMSKETFLTFRRIYYSLPYFSVFLYFDAVEGAMLGRSISGSVIYSLLVISLSPLVVPSFPMAREIAFFLTPVLVLLSIMIFVDTLRARRYEFLGPFTFLSLAASYFAVTIWKFPNPGILSFGIGCSMFSSMKYVYVEFKGLRTDLVSTKRKSMVDPLTGAFNRRVFENLPRRLKGSLVFTDLDGFKMFNDMYGHEKGDDILKKFSEVVRGRLRKDDVFIRYGGDEFVIILNNCDKEKATEIMEQIRRCFEKKTGLSFSYGVSVFDGNVIKAIKKADEEMYRMKNFRRG